MFDKISRVCGLIKSGWMVGWVAGMCCGLAMAQEDRGECFRNVGCKVFLYDTEHKAGVLSCVFANSDVDDRGLLDELALLYPPYTVTPFFSVEWSDGNYYTQAYPYGTPFISKHTSAQSEPFAMWDVLNCGEWHTVVAIPVSSKVGEYEIRTEPLGTTVQVAVVANIGDELGSATHITHWANLEDLFSRSVTLEVRYLPGNELEGLGSEQASYSEFSSDGIYARWGSPTGPQDGVHTFQEERPFGPIRIVLKVEGYSDDWIDLDVAQPTLYKWNALLLLAENDPGPSASDLMAGFGLQPTLTSSQNALLLDWALLGHVEQFSNVAVHMDQNADEAWDVSDVVRNGLAE